MKNKRIVTSLNQIDISMSRREAMLQNVFRQAAFERAFTEKEQEMNHKRNSELCASTTARKNHLALKKRWPLVLVACTLLAITLVACIPEARAEVLSWFGKIFDTQSYMGEESINRSSEPSLDAVITKIENPDRSATVNNVLDTIEAQTLADNFGVRLDEVAYTGRAIYVTGWLTRAAGKFLLDQYTGGDTWTKDAMWTDGYMCLTLQNGEAYYSSLRVSFTEEMDEIMEQAFGGDAERRLNMVYENGQLVTSNPKADELWNAWLQNNNVRFVCQFDVSQAESLELSNQTHADLSFTQYAKVAENEADVILFRADLGSIYINAELYNDAVSVTDVASQTIALTGTHRMFITEHNLVGFSRPHVNYYVEHLDMSGVNIAVESLTFTPTGPEIALKLDMPASWTRTERIAAVYGSERGGLDFLILLDGEPQPSYIFRSRGIKAVFGNDDDPFLTSPRILCEPSIAPSQWDAIQTITLIPYTSWPPELIIEKTVDGGQRVRNRVALRPGTVVTQDAMDDSEDMVIWEHWERDVMKDFAITIHLDDYR